MKEIVSTQNSQVKKIRSLCNKKGRDTCNEFVVEGYNIIKDMPRKNGALYVRKSDLQRYAALVDAWETEPTVVEDFVFDSLSDTVNSNGVLAVVEIPKAEALKGEFVLVADGISDAGNMGTIIRTAAAMSVKDIVCIDTVDVFNPKTVRSTMGGIFHTNVIKAKRAEIKEILIGYDIAVLDMAGEDIFGFRPSKKTAIVVGNEAHGVSDELKSLANKALSIPMYGDIESLNAAVSVSTALAIVAHNIRK